LLLFALGAWRWQKRRNTPGVALLLTLAAAFVLSLADCLLLTRTDSNAAFYLLPARVWEFALGALAYLLCGQSGMLPLGAGAPATRWLGQNSRWVGWCGLVAIIAAACIFDAGSAWPGAKALLPTLGTVAVLLAGDANAGVGVSRLLSAPVPNFLGRISYGWYLWHWPVLMLGAALFPARGVAVMVALVGLSLLLAWASMHLLERPVRNSAWLAKKPGATLAGGLALMLAAVVSMQAWQAQAWTWADDGTQGRYADVRSTRSAIYAAGCDEWYFSDRLRPCVTGNESAAQHVVLIGDSVGLQWHDALVEAFPAPRWRVTVLTKSSCPMVDSAFVYPRIGRRYFECERWRNAALDYIAAIKPDVVVMGSSAEYGFGPREWETGTRAVVGRIATATDRIVVLAPTPLLTFDPLVCLARRDWRLPSLADGMTCAEQLGQPRSKDIADWLRRGTAGFANARVAGFDELVCPDGTCSAEREGIVVYRDPQHLSTEFVRSRSADFATRLADAMKAAAPLR
ncbi:MAG TPA: acyltransferase family protein, partial [Luteimonas sp.]|nr:acyltransferase family protein [Luteimonas sp.]